MSPGPFDATSGDPVASPARANPPAASASPGTATAGDEERSIASARAMPGGRLVEASAHAQARALRDVRALVVCEHFDGRGYGLSAATRAFCANLTGVDILEAIAIHRPSGSEALGYPLAHLEGGAIARVLKDTPDLARHAQRAGAQLVHFHGVWTFAVRWIPALTRAGIAVVVSPHGMLEPFIIGNHPLRKALITHGFQRRALLAADAIHALNAHEQAMSEAYLRLAPTASRGRIEVIPNGVASPTAGMPMVGQSAAHDGRSFLFCGRLHPKKRVDLLLDAWRAAGLYGARSGGEGGHRLLIAGSGTGAYAEGIIARCAVEPGVEYIGEVSGASKEAAYGRSHFGVLTSTSEGQPMALLESLSSGRPCVATAGCRLPEIASEQLGWMAEGVDGLASALVAAASLDASAYGAMSQRALAYSAAHHDWRVSGRRMSELYRRLLDNRQFGAPAQERSA